MDLVLLLILLEFTHLRGYNIFLEVASQLPGNQRGVEEKNNMGAWCFPSNSGSLWLLMKPPAGKTKVRGKKTNWSKSKIGKQEKIPKAETRSLEEAIQWTGRSGELGPDSQPSLPWCTEPACFGGVFQLSHSGVWPPQYGSDHFQPLGF